MYPLRQREPRMMGRTAYQPGFSRALALLIVAVVLSTSCALVGNPAPQKRFSTPEQAVAALVNAVRDNNDGELLAILGPGSEDLVSSGDPVADRRGKARFLKAYAEKHHLDRKDDSHTLLIVGANDYPFPIPIELREGGWQYDSKAGMEEILNRRIGRNELHTIEVMQAYSDAQREFACRKGGSEFAQKFTSSAGEQDGLYWGPVAGEPESPLGPLVARAAEEGYKNGLTEESPEPFHGYYFKILKAQGAHADGGAFDYVVDGKMVLGFALVAYPAKYGASGIMTFMVNQEGVIYEKDLGKDTETTAVAMSKFDPDDSWRKYEEPGAQ